MDIINLIYLYFVPHLRCEVVYITPHSVGNAFIRS